MKLRRRGSQGEEQVASVLIRLGLEALVNRVLEEERTDFLGRERYERVAEEEKRGHRNGYKPGHIHTAAAARQDRYSPDSGHG